MGQSAYTGANAAVAFSNRGSGLDERFRQYTVCDGTAVAIAIVNLESLFGCQVTRCFGSNVERLQSRSVKRDCLYRVEFDILKHASL